MCEKKEKLLIYPYGFEFAPVIRNRQLLHNYEIVHLISPIGFAIKGEDAGVVDGGSKINKSVKTDFNKYIDECDTLLVADCNVTDKYKKIVYDNILIAINKGKNIICTLELDRQQIDEIKKKAELNNVYFKYYGRFPKQDSCGYNYWTEEIFEIEVPVVFVAGVTENTNKFEIQLNLKKQLDKLGYKVSQIGTRHYCELLGIHSFPSFMIDSKLSESDKIILFNRFLKEIEEKEMPDIIIIGIPGGLMPFNKKYTNKFGILAYEVSQAVTPDFAMLSVLYEELESKYFDMINTLTKYRFGFEVDCFNLSNAQFNLASSKENKKIRYNFLNSEFIDNKKSEYIDYGKPVYHIFNEDDRNRMIDVLIDTLSSYSSSEIANIGVL